MTEEQSTNPAQDGPSPTDPQPSAEQAKRAHGHVIPSMVGEDEEVEIEALQTAAAPSGRSPTGAKERPFLST